VNPRARRAQLCHQPRDAPVEGRVAETIVDGRAIHRVLAELGVELIDRVCRVGPVGGDGALDARTAPVPDFHLAVPRTHEQDVPLLDVRGIDDGDGVGLVEPGEEEEVARLPELEVHVAVARPLGGAGDDGHGVADGRGKALTTLEERREVGAHGYLDTIASSRWPA
jgi:hypothetical protein